MELFEPCFENLVLDRRELYRSLGMGEHDPPPEITDSLDEILRSSATVCQPSVGFRMVPVDKVTESSVSAGGACFHTGAIISPFFSQARYIAVFVATCGAEYAGFLRAIRADGDIVKEFVADAVGSEIAEASARFAAARIGERAVLSGYKTGNPYSPGYCGWSVGEQKLLFSLLPPSPCGIILNNSCLMEPVKSVSGIIPVGPNVKKSAYGCGICGKVDCYKRRKQV